MSKILVYTGKHCAYCEAAKRLLQSKNIDFLEIDLSTLDNKELETLLNKSKMRTVPQIFFGNELIGGYTELEALNRENGLNEFKNCG